MPGFETAEGVADVPLPADRANVDEEPSILPQPDADQRPETEPSKSGPTSTPADDKPAKEKSDDANLFDEADLRRRSQERLALLGHAAVQQERLRRDALRQQSVRMMRTPGGGGAVRQTTHVEPGRR